MVYTCLDCFLGRRQRSPEPFKFLQHSDYDDILNLTTDMSC